MIAASDRNLLFGAVALQMDFVTRDALLIAINAWVLEKAKPLGEILVEQNALTPSRQAMLEALVDEHVKQHGDDPQKSLNSISAFQSVRAELATIADSELQASLTHFSNAAAGDGTPLIDPTLPLSAISSSGARFRFLRPWREGALGKVSVALDEELHREVALKEIKHQHAHNKHSRERFLLEAEITGALEHPGIVPVYGLGHYHDGRPFYAMRFVRGDSLEEAIDRFHTEAEPNSTEASAARFDSGQRSVVFRELLGRFIDVCNAVAYAHSRGVLHRDLKPGNIILGKYGETLVVDWGLAKAQGKKDPDQPPGDEAPVEVPSGSSATPTRMGTLIGTPAFMSPEQADGRLDLLGPPSDVYSLGATLYAVLTGVTPFRGCDLTTLLARVRSGGFPRPRQINRSIAPALEAICLKAMSVAPADRYPSATALANDLEHWLADEPVTARQDSLYDRVFRLARRHRSVAIATTAAAIVIAVVASVAAVLVNQHAREKSYALAETRLALGRAEESEKRAKNSEQVAKSAEDEAKKSARAEAALRAAAEEFARSAEEQRKRANELAQQADLARQDAEKSAKQKMELTTMVERQRDKAVKLSEFLISALQPDDPTTFTGATFYAPKANWQSYTVGDMVVVGCKRAYEELGDAPLAQAAVLDSIGDICRQLALFDNVESALLRALQIRRNELPQDDPDVATSCFHAACYYQERGIFDKAKPLYEESLRIRRKLNDGPRVAEAQQNLAWLYYYENSEFQMQKCFDEALQIRESLLAKATKDRRRPLLRDVVYTKLGIASALIGKRHLERAISLAKNELLQEQLRELQGNEVVDALAALVRVLEPNRPLDHPGIIRELTTALTLLKASKKPEPVLEANIHHLLALQFSRADRLQEADREYNAALKTFRDKGMLQIPLQADKIKEAANVRVRLNKPREADELWNEYLKEQKFRFGVQHRFYIEAKSAYDSFNRQLATRR